MSNGTPATPPAPAPPRRSVFGGLVLIIVGVLLLMATLRPDIRAWRWIADYWPVLLILWGLSKLFDYFAARNAGAPPPRTLRGGEIFLLIFIIFIGLSVSAARRFTVDNDIDIFDEMNLGRPYSFSEELKHPLKPGQQVSINTDRGDISVYAEDAQEIRVVVKKTARAFEPAEAEGRAKDVKVVFQEVPGGVEILPKVDSDNQRGVRIDLEVHLPKNSAIKAKTERGNVQVTGTTGAVSVIAYRGEVALRSITGDVDAEVRRGDLRISDIKGPLRVKGTGGEIEITDVSDITSIQGEFYGPIRLKNVAKEVSFHSRQTDLTISQLPGRMEMGSGNLEIFDTPGSVILTGRKDVVLENIGGRIRIDNRDGNIQIRLRQAPKEEIDIQNQSAGIELALPGSATFELNASSRNGEVNSEFESPELKHSSDDRSSTLIGKVGAKGPKVQLRTTYGSVHIRKLD